jgi:integrase
MASVVKYKGGPRWQARWRDPAGRSQTKVFPRKADAERWLHQVEHEKLAGTYVDPRPGRMPFRDYASEWQDRQVWRGSTAEHYHHAFARVDPIIGDRPLSSIRTSELQALVRKLSDDGLAPATVEATYRAVAGVLKAAVVDRVLATSPAVRVRLPRVDRPKVQPLSLDQVRALAPAVPDRVRGAVLFAAGSGLRMGEVLGLTVDCVDFLRRTVTVDRQMITPAKGEPTFGPPKTKASHRTVPLAQITVDELAEHLARFPAGDEGLIFTSTRGEPWRRGTFAEIIRDGRAAAELSATVTFHDLRHHYASVLIAAGCSIKAVQNALGHANASETLDTYSHLWPSDEDRMREAVQLLHGNDGRLSVVRP